MVTVKPAPQPTYKTQKHLVRVERENAFDEHVINYRLRIDRWIRSVELRAMDPTGGDKFTPPGRQTRLVALTPYAH